MDTREIAINYAFQFAGYPLKCTVEELLQLAEKFVVFLEADEVAE